MANRLSSSAVSVGAGHRALILVWALAGLLALAWSTVAQCGSVTRVSVSTAGLQANGASDSYPPAFSADGRYVAFQSDASNLVPNDTNGVTDIFRRDLVAGTTIRVSVSDTEDEAEGPSTCPSISADGRYVAFLSEANNLVSYDTMCRDAFVRDCDWNTTKRASIDHTGLQSNGDCSYAEICGNGRYVAFISEASDVFANDTNDLPDAFRWDREGPAVIRVSLGEGNVQAVGGSPSALSISYDGRYVAMETDATNMVAGDTNGVADVFRRDVDAQSTVLVGVDNSGAQCAAGSSQPSISDNGNFVAFTTSAANMTAGIDANASPDVFVRDIGSGTNVCVSVNSEGQASDGASFGGAISGDGSIVAFLSFSTDLVASPVNADCNAFVRDLTGSTTTQVDLDPYGGQPDAATPVVGISGDGAFVAFTSEATDLVPNDTNSCSDAFVYSEAGYQPDGLICTGATYIGDGIYNSTGVGQSHARSVRAETAAAYLLAFENDAPFSDSFVVTGTAGAGAWGVKYVDLGTGTDITASVTGTGWTTPLTAAGGSLGIRVEVTPGLSAAGNAEFSVLVTATSAADPGKSDTVKGTSTCLTRYLPDGEVGWEGFFVGDGVFNGTGVDQTWWETASPPDKITYTMRFHNEGNVNDAFVLIGRAGNPRWEVSYFDEGTEADITASLTGGGWTTAALAVGGYATIRVEVTPAYSAPYDSSFAALVRATSAGGGTRDVVVASTRRGPVSRPDGVIYDGSTPLGNDTYNTTGTGQTVARAASIASTVTFPLRVYNDGSPGESYKLTGTATNSSLRVQYLDVATSTDITSSVIGGGWLTPDIPALGYRRINMMVTPQPGLPIGAVRNAVLTITSTEDHTKVDAVRAQVTCLATHLPDVHIHNGSAFIGDNTYNITGAGQTHDSTVATDVTTTYTVRAYNDGNIAEAFRVGGTAGNSRWAVAYTDASTGTDITSDVTGGGWTTPVLAVGGYRALKVVVTPLARAAGNTLFRARLVAVAAGGGTSDVALARTTCAPGYQPDGLIYSGTAYLGDGVYNTTGAGQTHALAVALGRTATYLVQLCNDGNLPQVLSITGTAGSGDWTVQYVDVATGDDITAAVTGAGWASPALNPRSYRRIKVYVSPGPSVAPNAALSVLLTAASTVDATKRDAVKATTTRR